MAIFSAFDDEKQFTILHRSSRTDSRFEVAGYSCAIRHGKLPVAAVKWVFQGCHTYIEFGVSRLRAKKLSLLIQFPATQVISLAR